MTMRYCLNSKTVCCLIYMYTVSQNVTTFVLLLLRHTWTNFDNFWQKCYWKSKQSKGPLFSLAFR